MDELLVTNFSIYDKIAQIKNTQTIKILFLARLEKEKGIFETIDAVASLIQKGIPVSLSIAGDGKVLDEVKRYVRQKTQHKNLFLFLGYVKNNDKIKAFTDHHVYCLPTYYGEGLPNSILEAMAFGLPIVTRPVGGILDFFEDQKMGLLVQEKSSEDIADSLEKLIHNRHNMMKISMYNAEYAKKNFMASIVAKRLLKTYDTILER